MPAPRSWRCFFLIGWFSKEDFETARPVAYLYQSTYQVLNFSITEPMLEASLRILSSAGPGERQCHVCGTITSKAALPSHQRQCIKRSFKRTTSRVVMSAGPLGDHALMHPCASCKLLFALCVSRSKKNGRRHDANSSTQVHVSFTSLQRKGCVESLDWISWTF